MAALPVDVGEEGNCQKQLHRTAGVALLPETSSCKLQRPAVACRRRAAEAVIHHQGSAQLPVLIAGQSDQDYHETAEQSPEVTGHVGKLLQHSKLTLQEQKRRDCNTHIVALLQIEDGLSLKRYQVALMPDQTPIARDLTVSLHSCNPQEHGAVNLGWQLRSVSIRFNRIFPGASMKFNINEDCSSVVAKDDIIM